MSLDRVEIWSDLEANSGTHQGNIPRADLLAAISEKNVDGKDEIQLMIDRASTAWTEIENERVFRLVDTDGSVEEYRIKKPVEGRDQSGAEKATIKAIGMLGELANGIVSRDESDGTVTLFYTLLSLTRLELVTLMVAAAPNYFSVGTVDDEDKEVEAFTFNFDSPLKALQELASMEGLELGVRRSGTAYAVDLVEKLPLVAANDYVLDTFTEASDTDILLHTSDTGEEYAANSGAFYCDAARSGGVLEGRYKGSQFRAAVGDDGGAAKALNIGDEVFCDMYRPTGFSGGGCNIGFYFMSDGNGISHTEYYSCWVNCSASNLMYLSRYYSGGSESSTPQVVTWAFDSWLRFGVTCIDTDKFQLWTEPVGGGARTNVYLWEPTPNSNYDFFGQAGHAYMGVHQRTTQFTTGDYIAWDNLTTRTPGSGDDGAAEFRYRKNLNGITRVLDSAKLANRFYPAGGGDDAIRLSVAEATWEVTSVPTTTSVVLAGDPIFEDDVLNGKYLERPNGTLVGIDDCSADAQSIETASSHSLNVGDLVKFRANATGGQLVYVESLLSQASYGLRVAVNEENDLPTVNNFVPNAAFVNWVADNPDEWIDVGTPTVTRETSELYTMVGGSSAKVVADEGEGIKSADITIAPSDPNVFYSAFVSVFVESGEVEFFLDHSTEGRFPQEGDDKQAVTSEHDRFITLIIEGKEWPAGDVSLSVVARNGSATFYVDSAQLTNTGTNLPFYNGNAACKLWQRGLDKLAQYIAPIVSYAIEATDLFAVEPELFPYDKVTVGTDVFIEDEQLNLQVTTRVLSVRRDLLLPHVINMTLSNKPRDLIDILTRRGRRVRQNTQVRPGIAAISLFRVSHKDDGTVVLQLFGSGGTRSFMYIADYQEMPTFNEVIESGGDGVVSNVVDGTEIILTEIRGTSATKLSRGKRLLVRAVAFPILDASGVPGATATDIVGPPAFWNASIDDTVVNQTGNGGAGTANVHRTFEVTDVRTAAVRIYRKKDSWPTMDNTQTGALDPDYDRGTVGPQDNWEYVDGGYSTGDGVRDIAVAEDCNGLEGERENYAEYVVTGAASSPRIASAFAGDVDLGSDCMTDQRDMRVYWVLENCNDTDHEVRVYYTRDGDGPYLLGTEGDPVSNTTMENAGNIPAWYSGAGGQYYTITHIVELWDVSGAPVKLDSKTAPDPTDGPWWTICVE